MTARELDAEKRVRKLECEMKDTFASFNALAKRVAVLEDGEEGIAYDEAERARRAEQHKKIRVHNLRGEAPTLPSRLVEWPDYCAHVEQLRMRIRELEGFAEATDDYGGTCRHMSERREPSDLNQARRNAIKAIEENRPVTYLPATQIYFSDREPQGPMFYKPSGGTKDIVVDSWRDS